MSRRRTAPVLGTHYRGSLALFAGAKATGISMSRRLSRFFLGTALCLGFACAPLVMGPATAASAQTVCTAEWIDEGPFVAGKSSPAYEYDSYSTYSLWLRVRTLGGETWRYQNSNCTKGALYYQYAYTDRTEHCNAAGHFGCQWINSNWGVYDGLTTKGTQRLSGSTIPYAYYDDVYDAYRATANLKLNTGDPGL